MSKIINHYFHFYMGIPILSTFHEIYIYKHLFSNTMYKTQMHVHIKYWGLSHKFCVLFSYLIESIFFMATYENFSCYSVVTVF